VRKPGTEPDWLNAVLVAPMLYILRDTGRGSARKLRLFAVACCRRAWHLLRDERSRKAVEVGERYADGQAGAEELNRADRGAMAALDEICTSKGKDIRVVLRKAPIVFPRNASPAVRWACAAAWTVAEDAERTAWTAEGVANLTELKANCDLLRCIVYNPFRPVPSVVPPLLEHDGGLVKKLAQAAYEDRSLPAGALDNARLAVLADALEDAGLADAEALGHLRSAGPHVRGCWALDAVLGLS
jgi:hypothetical protein